RLTALGSMRGDLVVHLSSFVGLMRPGHSERPKEARRLSKATTYTTPRVPDRAAYITVQVLGRPPSSSAVSTMAEQRRLVHRLLKRNATAPWAGPARYCHKGCCCTAPRRT